MRRILSAVVLGLIGALAFGAAPAPLDRLGPATKPPSPEEVFFRELLAERKPWDGLERDNNFTLASALDELTKNSEWQGVSFRLDVRAFERAGVGKVGETAIVADSGIAGGEMSLKMVLKKLLERVPVKGGAAYVLRRNAIEITTTKTLRDEVWGKGHPGPFFPLLHATITKRPLRSALQALAEQGDRSILLDRSAPGARTLVRAEFCNVPLDDAVKYLARQAGLRVVSIEGGLYVTTRTEAEAIARRQRGETSASTKRRTTRLARRLPGIASAVAKGRRRVRALGAVQE